MKFYREIKESKKLLPNQRIFKLHGILLALWLGMYFVGASFYQIMATFKGAEMNDVILGIGWIGYVIMDATEMFIFGLVVYLLLPLTE